MMIYKISKHVGVIYLFLSVFIWNLCKCKCWLIIEIIESYRTVHNGPRIEERIEHGMSFQHNTVFSPSNVWCPITKQNWDFKSRCFHVFSKYDISVFFYLTSFAAYLLHVTVFFICQRQNKYTRHIFINSWFFRYSQCRRIFEIKGMVFFLIKSELCPVEFVKGVFFPS